MISTILALTALSGAPATPVTNDVTTIWNDETAATQTTRFDDLASRFNVGFAASRESSEGWYSGRCYSSSAPNTAVGNILITETRTAPGNEGPIFDRPVTKFFVVGRGSNGYGAAPEYFDNMTPAQMAEVQAWVDQNFHNANISEAYEYGNSYATDYYRTRWESRTDRQFHFVRTTDLGNGNAYAYCYFFKKVK